MASSWQGEWATVAAIGMALGMDAFSLGVALGAQGLRWRDVARLSAIISAFHVVLPLFSIWIGDLLYARWGRSFERAGACILLALGARMAVSAFRGEAGEHAPPPAAGWVKLTAFGFGVSVDALSVGLGLGSLAMSPASAALMFGLLSGMLSLIGLYLGRKASRTLGDYGQVAGGAVLLLLGVKLFL